ncbi:fused MFS/spermidine synthase [Solwaraspora sp. WMMD406]|uniref:spermidine synthase n=1 Tax=Solwaraspora sp. WMMD406 TaxID=3016095 RepID=UPI0024162466|nr:fused MFS/spermidine synthase [Solwaraspora sp. WMMD406]MDG4766971.1 fused MFS/spermidine synthase [Solwaraspora sp. WMMD406]
MGRVRRSEPPAVQVDTGTARLAPDPDRRRAYTLLLDGTQQSHVDLDDPTHLEFEYIRRIAAAIDLAAPVGAALRVLHLGGGALTLPRYLMATRPGSTQRVVEIDGALADLVRRELPWPADRNLRVRIGDARATVEEARPASYDLVIADVFAAARTPAGLTSVEFVAAVERILAPGGQLLSNVADGPPLRWARRHLATVRSVLPDMCVIADAAVLRQRRYGNLVVVAGRTAPRVGELTRRAAGDWFPARVVHGEALDRLLDAADVIVDADAEASPPPPGGVFLGGR